MTLGKAAPPLALAYRNAVYDVCGRYVTVPEKWHDKFRYRQAVLDEEDFDYDEFAHNVVRSWWPWCRKQGMPSVPLSIFLGPKAWSRFVKTLSQASVHIDTLDEDKLSSLVYEEMTAVQAWLGCLGATPLDVIRPKDAEYLAYETMVVGRVLADLRQLYDIPNAKTYQDIMEAFCG